MSSPSSTNEKKKASHTPGPWRIGTPRSKVEIAGVEREIGLDFLTNEGQRAIMAPDTEMGHTRVALVDCKTPFKRGKGYESKCEVREANARLIAAGKMIIYAICVSVNVACYVALGHHWWNAASAAFCFFLGVVDSIHDAMDRRAR